MCSSLGNTISPVLSIPLLPIVFFCVELRPRGVLPAPTLWTLYCFPCSAYVWAVSHVNGMLCV